MAASGDIAAATGKPLDIQALLKDAAIAALVALALAATMVGLQTISVQSRLVVDTRFLAVLLAVGLVFIGQLSIGLTREGHPVLGLLGAVALCVVAYFTPSEAPAVNVIAIGGGAIIAIQALAAFFKKSQQVGQGQAGADASKGNLFQQFSVYIGFVGIAFAIMLPLIFQDRYRIDIATLVLTYVMLGWGLNIIVGLAGLLDLGYVAFYAVGAYSYALLGTTFGWSFWVCLPLAGVLAALAGLILGFPVLRLRGDYFAIVTLGFGEIIRIILLNWYPVTRGPDGIGNIPRPSFFGLAEFGRTPSEPGGTTFHEMFGLEFSGMHRVIFLYYLILVLALVVNFVSLRLRRLPIGRSWEALREDDIACQSLGINRRNIKLAAFTISAMFGGLAGSFFATRQGFISPESFTFLESAIILAIVVLGGMGSQTGVVIASLLLIGLPEIFRELEQYRMLAFGGAMVFIMVWRPRGLLAHRDPSVRLYKRGKAATDPGGGVPQRAGAAAQ
ncbi:MAG: high-affinity branched-chain amino acid ABC transporter permease LivM [Pseudomonadota bacterium]